MFKLYVKHFGCDYELEDTFNSKAEAVSAGKFMLSNVRGVVNYRVE
jgi:hypothetical protein